ncbi:MAG: hypothetical protein ACXWXS_09210, partial [Actinomycetota bacterium]
MARSSWARWGVIAAVPFVLAIAAGGTVLRMEQGGEARADAGPGGSTTSPASTAPPSAPAPDGYPDRFTLAFSGDILIHESLWERAARAADGDGRY